MALGEQGKWQNWGSDIFLEEKMFPNLFPYGIGGYLSSSFLSGQNMGFSNYIKSRLLSTNSKFRDDPMYVFFLLLVKEMVQTQYSTQTFFRDTLKNCHLANIFLTPKTPLFSHFNIIMFLNG